MNIIVFTTYFSLKSGYERLSLELFIWLKKKGYNVGIVSQFDLQKSCLKDYPEIFKTNENNDVYLLNLVNKLNIFKIFKSILLFRKIIVTKNYQFIEVSAFAPSVIAYISTIGINTKIIIGIHDDYSIRKYKVFKFLIWKLFLKNKKIYFYSISNYVYKKWIKYSKTKKKNNFILYNSINNEYFNRKKFNKNLNLKNMYNLKKDSICILSVGRLMHRKGIDVTIQAMNLLKSSIDIHLFIVGRKDDSDRNDETSFQRDNNNFIKSNKLTKSVHFLGERNDVAELMCQCDLFVHSARVEGFGLVLVEAMASGLPVISTNVGGIPEVLRGSKSILVPPGEPKLLASAIISYSGWSKKKIDDIKQTSRECALNYTVERRGVNFISHLQKIC